jgi:hypothetical protein
MLKSCLLHPEILEALGRAGHSSRILIHMATNATNDIPIVPAPYD